MSRFVNSESGAAEPKVANEAWVPPPAPPTPLESPPPGWQTPAQRPLDPWRPLGALSTALTSLFALAAVLSVALVVLTISMASAVDDAEGGGFAEFSDALDVIERQSTLLGLYQAVFIATAVVFIIWMYRLAKNNQGLGRKGRYGPGMAIGGWFIPFANFVIPGSQMSEIWRGADPEIAPGSEEWKALPRSWLVRSWWITYLLGTISYWRVSSTSQQTGTTISITEESRVDALRQLLDDSSRGVNTVLSTIGLSSTAVAAVLALVLVRRLSDRQHTAAEPVWGASGSDDGRRWWWAALPVGVVALCSLALVFTWGDDGSDSASSSEVQEEAETFVDPDGIYELEVHDDWVPLTDAPTGVEAFGVGPGTATFSPYLQMVTGEDAAASSSLEYAEAVADSIEGTPDMEVETGVLEGVDGDLAFVDWALTPLDGDKLQGHAVVGVSNGTWMVAELIAPIAGFTDLSAEVEPYQHSIRFAD